MSRFSRLFAHSLVPMKPMKWVTSSVLALSLGACGGTEAPRTIVDESDDFVIQEPTSQHLAGTQPVGPEVAGTQWTFREAHCTEGPLDLSSLGFERTTRVSAYDQGLLLIHDDTEASEGAECTRTIVQHAKPGATQDAQWSMAQEAIVDVGACSDRVEPNRPGDVRRRARRVAGAVAAGRSNLACVAP